jgi:hypothetical protein
MKNYYFPTSVSSSSEAFSRNLKKTNTSLTFSKEKQEKTNSYQQEEKFGKSMEEMFLRNSFEIIDKGLSNNPLTGGGFAENMYRSLFHELLAKEIVKGDGMGISPLIAQELIMKKQMKF